jgi:hypothetical protein
VAFDVAGARSAGYSDREIVEHLSGDVDFDVNGALGAGYSMTEIADYMGGLEPDETSFLGSVGEAVRRIPGGLVRGLTSTVTGAGQLIPGVDDEMLVDAQREIDATIRDTLGYDPDYDDSNVAAIGEAIGQIGSFMVPGLGLAKLATVGRGAQTALAGGIGSAQGLAIGAEERQQAMERGVEISETQKNLAKASDVAIGALEVAGVPFRILRGLPKGFEDTPEGGVLMRRLRSAVAGGFAEGTQEAISGIARDIAASSIYDPDREIASSVVDDFAVGAGAGGIFDFAFSLATGRYKRKAPDAPPEIQEPTPEEAEAEREARVREEEKAEQFKEQEVALAQEAERVEADLTGPPTEEVAEQGMVVPGRSEQLIESYRYGRDLARPEYGLDVEQATPERVARRIVTRLGQNMPMGATFDASKERITADGVEYGPIIRDEQKRQEVANRLTAKSQRQIPPSETITPLSEAYQLDADDLARTSRRLAAQSNALEAQIIRDQKDLETISARKFSTPVTVEDDLLTAVAKLGGIDTELARQDGIEASRNPKPYTGRYRVIKNGGLSFDEMGEMLADNGFYAIRPSANQVLQDIDDALNKFDEFARYEDGKFKPSPDAGTYFGGKGAEIQAKKRELEEKEKQIEQIGLTLQQAQAGQVPTVSLDESIAMSREGPAPPEAVVPARAQVTQTYYDAAQELPAPEAPQAEAAVEQETVAPEAPAAPQQALVPYDPDKTEVAQKLRAALKQFGLADDYTARLVDQVGRATYDADGNVVVAPDPRAREEQARAAEEGRPYIVEGNFSPLTRLIQVSLDAIRPKVEAGASYEQAIADVLNHEIVHALRRLDLFTAKEFSLLERVSRKYAKPDAGVTYANWAATTYSDRSPVEMQEEAIAEMIRDALTDGVVIDGRQTKPSGKIRQMINKIVDLFKRLAGFSQEQDINSFADLVEAVKSGEVGGRERGVVRTQTAVEREAGAIPERGVTAEVLGFRAGVPFGVGDTSRRVVGDTSDQPVIDEAMMSRRLARAEEQGFDTNTVYYHGTASPDIQRFRSEIPTVKGLIAGHFTRNPDFANKFVPLISREDEAGTVYPVFLRVSNTFDPFDKSMVDAVRRDIEKGRDGEGHRIASDLSRGPNVFDLSEEDILRSGDVAVERARRVIDKAGSGTLQRFAENRLSARAGRGKQALNFEDLEKLAPFIKGAGFDSYLDVENRGARGTITGIAVFDPSDIKGVYAEFDPSGVPEGMRYEDDIMFSRRATGTPITDAVARARKKHDGVRFSTEEEFFGRVWPSLMTEVGGTVPANKLRVAAKRAVKDLKEWVKNNPKYNDYYSEDMRATRASLEAEYGPISDEEFALYQFLNGVNSPGTSLVSNVGDAIKAFDLYKRDGNFDAIKMGISERGNPVVAESPYTISALTAPGKARSMKALDKIVRDKGSLKAALDFLREPVTMQELEAFKKGLGYAGVDKKGDIRGLVEDATGQAPDKNQLIPRMFFLGPKLGAYTLNLMGDSRYQTVDVWEARFIRSYFDNMYDTNTGITMTVEEGRLFRDFSKVFSEEFEKVAGYKADPATLQAMRWFYMINAAKEAGYSGASTNETISELTERQIENTRGSRYGGREASGQPIQVGEQAARATEEVVEDAPLARRQLDPSRVEQVVQQNAEEALDSRYNVPLYSIKASPDAQYIARNPDSALIADEVLEARQPQYSATANRVINSLTADRPKAADPMKEFMDATGESSALSYQLTKAKQATVNRYARLEKLHKRYFKDYLADTSAIASVLFADRSRGVTASAIKDGVPQYKQGFTQVVDFSHNGKKYRGLIDVIGLLRTKEHGDLSRLAQSYAIAMRGKRLNDEGKPTPVSKKDIDDVKAAVAEYTDVNGYNPIKEWYDVWQAYNNKVIQFLQDTGILSEETAVSWREASDYIPFYRALDKTAKVGSVTHGVFGDLTKLGSFRAYKGSDQAINVPLVEAIVKNTSAAIDMGMRNVAQQRIARDMQKLQLATQVSNNRRNDPGVVTFKVAGRPVSFEIHDPLIYESMQAIDSTGIEDFSRTYFGPFSNLLRETVTRSPGFMLANMFRDSLSAFVTSGANFIPLIDTTRGFLKDINNLERTGVVGGYDFSVGQNIFSGESRVDELFDQEFARRNKSGLQVNMFKSMWDFLGRATTRSDAATRQAVFNDVYSRTGNEAEAHFQAQEVLNFSRRGSNPVMRAITAAIPFLNARIQGLDVLYRGAIGTNNANTDLGRSRAALSFALRGALLASMTALYWTLVSDEDEYKEASPEERDNNWLIPLGDMVLKLPIPFEVGLIFKTIPEMLLDVTYGERTSRQAFETVKRGVTSTLEFDPIFGIQAFAPLLEASVNHNSYTGRPIVPAWMTGKLPEEQATDYTSELGRFIGDALDMSPMKIDHVMRGYTGTIGGYVLDWTDRVIRDPDVVDSLRNMGVSITSPEFPSAAIYDYPVLRRFLRGPEGTGLRDQFYDLYNDVKRTYNTMQDLREEGRIDDLNKLIATRGTLVEVKGPVYSLKKRLDKIRKQRQAIIRSDLDADVKRERLEELDAFTNKLLAIVPELEKAADRPMTRVFQ